MSASQDKTIGRRALLSRLESAIEGDAAIVTLVGGPGVGKSHIARHLARDLTENTSLDAPIIDLGAARDDSDLLVALERHLTGIGEGVSLDQIARRIDARWLVLDNFDYLVERAADLFGPWLEHDSAPRLIITSRRPLRLRGEQVIDIEPLDTEDAIELFCNRADMDVPSGERRERILRIVSRLDGNPLALEMAAERARVLSLSEIRTRLDNRLQLLKRQVSDGTGFESLRAALDWSWNSLDHAEQQFLSQCGVFEAGFTNQAVDAVVSTGDEAQSLDLLEALVDRSLIRRIDAPSAVNARFKLPESIRAYALEKLAEGAEPMAALHRHLSYYQQLFQSHLGAGREVSPRQIVTALGHDFENAVTAWRNSQKIAPEQAPAFGAIFGELLDAGETTTGLMTLVECGVSPTKLEEIDLAADELGERARSHLNEGRAAAALRDLDLAVERLDPDEDLALGVELHRTAARVHLRRDQLEAVTYHYERAIELASRIPDSPKTQDVLVKMNTRLGRVYMMLGQLDAARETLRHALDQVRSRGLAPESSITEPRILSYLAKLHLELDEMNTAADLAQESQVLARIGGDDVLVARLDGVLGEVHQRSGELDRAHEHYRRAIESISNSNDPTRLTLSLQHILLRIETSDFHGASKALSALRGGFETVKDPELRIQFDLCAGLSFLGLGDTESAQSSLEDALELAHRAGRQLDAAMSLALLGLVASIDARPADAIQNQSVALKMARGQHATLLQWIEQVSDIVSSTGAGRTEREGASDGDTVDPATVLDALEVPVGDGDAPLESLLHRATRATLHCVIGEHTEHYATSTSSASKQPPHRPEPDSSSSNGDSLVIGPKAAWFELPSGERVELGRKYLLRRLLDALVENHLESTSEPITAEKLIEAGWPNQSAIRPDSARNRLHVALNRLRSEGLDDLLVTAADGYLLDPDVAIRRSSSPD